MRKSLGWLLAAIVALGVPFRISGQTGGVFVPITPCRMADTRTDSTGGPITSSTVRNFRLTGDAYTGFSGAVPCAAATGIPPTATSVAVNFTLATIAGSTDLRVAPWGTPPTSSIANGKTSPIANAAVETVASDGAGNMGISVISGGASFNLILDVLGYLTTSGHGVSPIVQGLNLGSGVDKGPGVSGFSVGDVGVSGSGSPGVEGLSNTGQGVFGLSTSGDGLYGSTSSGSGVYAVSSTGDGVYSVGGAIGVLGIGGTGNGVEGQSSNSAQSGVAGFNFSSGTGVYGQSASGNAGYFNGPIVATNLKSFIEPHPTDPTKEIKYVSLEGRESGTYFRGRSRIVDGLATIEVPEDFRMVSSETGLSVQLTPIGDLAVLAVASQDLDRVVVRGSRDVEFHYMVNGVRRAFVGFEPIGENRDFVPRSPDARVLTMGLPAESLRRLKANGILNADGSINLETARRLGWDKRPGWPRQRFCSAPESSAQSTIR